MTWPRHIAFMFIIPCGCRSLPLIRQDGLLLQVRSTPLNESLTGWDATERRESGRAGRAAHQGVEFEGPRVAKGQEPTSRRARVFAQRETVALKRARPAIGSAGANWLARPSPSAIAQCRERPDSGASPLASLA